MSHPYMRTVELVLGVAFLLSVASVPVPRRPRITPSPAVSTAPLRAETLRQQAVAQSREVADLTREARQISELLRAQQGSSTHPPRRVSPGIVREPVPHNR